MSELYKTETVIESRKQQIREQGFWICPKCLIKYYLGHNCDICMYEEFTSEMKKIRRGREKRE